MLGESSLSNIFGSHRVYTYLYTVLVYGLNKVENFIALPQKSLDERRRLCLLSVRGGHEVDVLLFLFHPFKVLLEAGESSRIVARLKPEGRSEGEIERGGGREREYVMDCLGMIILK